MRVLGLFLVAGGTASFIGGGFAIEDHRGVLGLSLLGAGVLTLCIGTALWAVSHKLPWAWGLGGLLGPLGFLIVLGSTRAARAAAAPRREKPVNRLRPRAPGPKEDGGTPGDAGSPGAP